MNQEVWDLLLKADQSKYSLKKWIKSSDSSTAASSVAAQEIVRCDKVFTDGEFMK